MEDIGYSQHYDYMDSSSPSWKETGISTASSSNQDSKTFQKLRQIDGVLQLCDLAEGLMTKLHRFKQALDNPDMGSYQFSEQFWKAGIFPELPKLCVHIAKKFPEHTGKLQLEKVDKTAIDQLSDNAESYLLSMEPWLMVLLELMKFREQAVKVILELCSTIITLLPNHNPLILHAFMNLFCSFVRVHLLSAKVPREMLLQTYNLTHTILKNGRDYEFYHRLVQYVDSYDPPLKGLQEDLNLVISSRIGEILEGIAPTLLLGIDHQKLRSEGFLSPFHPRYPDKLTNSAHPARAQDLAYMDSYQNWVLIGYLVCPNELLRGSGIDIAMAVLRETLVLPIFRDEYILVHEEYQLHVLPKIDESKRTAKAGRKQKDVDQEYNLAKQVKKMICDAHESAIVRAESNHRERRTFLRQELSRMVLFFCDQPSLIAPNILMIFSALSMARMEVIWYFTHVGVLAGKAKGRIVPVEIEATDPSVGFLLNCMDKLQGLIQKYISAVRGYALGYLAGAGERIKSLLNSPAIAALDFELPLQEILNSVSGRLENIPKLHAEAGSTDVISLSGFRKEWMSLMMMVFSSRSTINARHLEKAAVPTGKESIISEGNAAYIWSRCVDDIEGQFAQHSSLKTLYFYRQHLKTVFRHTMFGPEGRPQHCCAWLRIACSFMENMHLTVPEEEKTITEDSISYVESVLESIMGGLEGLINILDSEGGFGSLEYKLSPDQAAIRLNQAGKSGNTSSKFLRSTMDLPLPGSESEPSNRDAVKMLEAAVQRLTGLCTSINDMEPICVLGHVFIPQEYLREHVLNNFRRRLHSIIDSEREPQRPSQIEPLILRHMQIIYLIEKHVSMDLKQGVREVLLKEAFSNPMRDLQESGTIESVGGTTVSLVCDWYMDNVVKDVSGSAIVFNPSDKTFRSSKLQGGSNADISVGVEELKAFVRIFGPYGVDKLENSLYEYLSVLVGCIDIALRSNKDALERLALNMHHHHERALALKQIQDIESLMAFSIQIGHALSFRMLLAEACADVLGAAAPTVFSLLSDFSKYAPLSIPEKEEIMRLKMLANRLGAGPEQDHLVLHSVLKKLGGAGESLWILLPYLFVSCMTSQVWSSSVYSIHTGGFNNNVHCLARCINAVIVASEYIRLERKESQRQHSQQQSRKEDADMERLESEALTLEGIAAVEANIKSSLKTYVQCSAVIVLDTWNESNRSPLVAKLIFLEQLCGISTYLPRSTLESHVPYTVLRSIYQLYYENAVPTLMLVGPTRRHGSGPSTSHAPMRSGSFAVDGSELSGGFSSFRSVPSIGTSKYKKHGASDKDHSNDRAIDATGVAHGVRLSGPLDYSGARKVSFVEGTTQVSGSHGSPFDRFTSSKSGPISYKH
ncbi:hypothetical protein KP509_07G024700 [Ceratopteris richardii]|uniref:Uncharacterized protein n=1 Tax=Ceratopteris richardii TaxID=49495 RepID=A0A8T2UJG4_CERRI|nr:hypothetical protein KP509_07G024700 [Ceratopteris richardii]KAH7432488.1 hypothetical protein KP509_07G024700 [Ceratopteris richardii]KAH7432489.1 hypothetical protein KP509_07G024700 [Ceratopteris richardii]